jgi:hypothetical protein
MVVILTADELRRARKREWESRWRWWRRHLKAEARRKLQDRGR